MLIGRKEDMTIKVKILPETTKDPISLIGRRAGCCTHACVDDPDKNFRRGMDCLKSNHGRALEFVQVDMEISGVSSRVIREWYTHIGGLPTRLQESTRYVNYGCSIPFVLPESIASNPDAFEYTLQFGKQYAEFIGFLKTKNIPLEDIAMFYPLGTETKIVDHRNLRNLIDMSHQRMCRRAYWEYRELFDVIRRKLCDYSEEWAIIVEGYLVPKCEYLGGCPESNSCGWINKQED